MDDSISRQAAIDALDVLCQEHRYKIPGKRETYSQYNEAWQDAIDRAEGAIFNLPSAQPEIIHCRECGYWKIDQPTANGYHCCHRNHNIFPMRDDDFCSRAKRREE